VHTRRANRRDHVSQAERVGLLHCRLIPLLSLVFNYYQKLYDRPIQTLDEQQWLYAQLSEGGLVRKVREQIPFFNFLRQLPVEAANRQRYPGHKI
jgi:hypothetical protein